MTLSFLHDLKEEIIGVDEVGRGSWSGPIVVCSILLNKKLLNHEVLYEIDDSKRLNKKKRGCIAKILKNNSIYSFGIVSADKIDKFGIQKSNELAIKMSLKKFSNLKNNVRIDGRQFFSIDRRCEFLIKGDQKSISIASASILAKNYRDEIMKLMSKKFKGYDWENNSGYGTPKHMYGLHKYGVCSEHRKSFEPIKKILNREWKN